MKQGSTKKRISIALVIAGLVVLSISILSMAPRPVHGQSTGLVCLSASTTSCPSSPPTFTGSVGSRITVNVVIQGSDSLNAFDIRVFADHTIVNGSSISITGSLLQSSAVLVDTCVNGFFMAGSCQPSLGTDEAIVSASMSTVAPTTGLLFSITYSILGASSSTPFSFPTGCSSSSVSGTTTCVGVANAGTVDSETIQGATFANTSGFTIAASSSSLSIHRGSSGTDTITVTATGGFTGTVNFSATVSPVVRHGPTASLTPSSVTLTAGSSVGASTLTVSTLHSTPTGSYTVTVNASSGSISHSVTIQVTVS